MLRSIVKRQVMCLREAGPEKMIQVIIKCRLRIVCGSEITECVRRRTVVTTIKKVDLVRKAGELRRTEAVIVCDAQLAGGACFFGCDNDSA